MWKLYTDRVSSSDGSEAGLMLVRPKGKEYTYAFRFEFETTNNEAEYAALLAGIRIAAVIKGQYKPRASSKRYIKASVECKQDQVCQIHSSILRKPKQDMTSITSAWPFSQWGIDIMGPLPIAPGGKDSLSFGIPKIIISDNGKQFAGGIFLVFCQKLGILQSFTSVYHPQANGQVEVTNRDIVKGMKRRLGKTHQGWVDELPQCKQSRVPKKNGTDIRRAIRSKESLQRWSLQARNTTWLPSRSNMERFEPS
ncbi:reverse transcriptase domain-containing protein [Tanacetum coccineum]